MPQYQYANPSTQVVADFFAHAERVKADANGKNEKQVFDSVMADNSVAVPDVIDRLFGKLDEGFHQHVLDSVGDGIENYKAMHGVNPPADLIEQALHNAYASQLGLAELKIRFDSATDSHLEGYSLQPNRAIVSILGAMSEAIPFAGYFPVDIGSNESKVLLVKNQARSNFGGYADGSSVDGTFSGAPFVMSNRFFALSPNNDRTQYTVTARTRYEADSRMVPDANSAALKLMAGRTQILVNGFTAAQDMRVGNTINGATTLAGTALIGNTTYSLSGSVNNDTGVITLNANPALPANTSVVAEVIADYQRAPEMVPSFGFEVESFSYFANEHQANTQIHLGSQLQVKNEANIDPSANSLFSLRTQLANEQHYHALQQAWLMSINNAETYDFDFDAQKAAKNIAETFADVEVQLSVLDQQMVNDTMDHGISHIYVNSLLKSIVTGLPRTIFEPSGVASRAGIYRVGKLFGKYDVYYTPKIVTQDIGNRTASMLCIGRSSDVGRCPIVMGDAVAPMFIPLATSSNLTLKQAYYQRSFMNLNKHMASARGCARLDFTGLPIL